MGGRTADDHQRVENEYLGSQLTQSQQPLLHQTATDLAKHDDRQTAVPNLHRTDSCSIPEQVSGEILAISASATTSAAAATTMRAVTPSSSLPQRHLPAAGVDAASPAAQGTVEKAQTSFNPATSAPDFTIPTIVVIPDKVSALPPAAATSSTTATTVANLEVPPPATPELLQGTAREVGCGSSRSVVFDEFEGEVAAESAVDGCVGSVARDVIHFFFSGGGVVAACASDALETGAASCQAGCSAGPATAADGCQEGIDEVSGKCKDDVVVYATDLNGELGACGRTVNNCWTASFACINSTSTILADSTSCSNNNSCEATARDASPLERPIYEDAGAEAREVLPASSGAASAADQNALIDEEVVAYCAKQLYTKLSSCCSEDAFSTHNTDNTTQDSVTKRAWHWMESDTCPPAYCASTPTVHSSQVPNDADVATNPTEAAAAAGADKNCKGGRFAASVQSYVWPKMPTFTCSSDLFTAQRYSSTSEVLAGTSREEEHPGEDSLASCGFSACEMKLFSSDDVNSKDSSTSSTTEGTALLCCLGGTWKHRAAAGPATAWLESTRKHMLSAVTAVSQLGGCYIDSHHISRNSITGMSQKTEKGCTVCSGLDFADVPLLS